LIGDRCGMAEAMRLPKNYQDDFETPGISPFNARLRKHRRHNPNLRRNARGRPQFWQRLCRREENFGLGLPSARAFSNFFWMFASLTLFAVVAICSFTERKLSVLEILQTYGRNGMPICFNNARP
jgi:hypothetical protein